MRTALHIVLGAMLLVPPTARAQSGPSSAGQILRLDDDRTKVAVVLSGGGAKGVAHIGALRAIEQAGVPIDMIVGTSMGAIVGGLYSIGYTTDQLDSMVMSQDWGVLLSDRTPRHDQPYSQKENDDRYLVSYPLGRSETGVSGLVNGTNLEMLFNDMMVGHHDSLDFARLPIPFACVATDIVDGSEKVFRSGVLPTAIRASMAIPGFFTPVYLDDAVLVDGGLVNNFPTDVARTMGADIVIGVDVQAGLQTKDDLTNAAHVARQIIELNMQQQDYLSKVADADVYVRVDVDGYTSQSFSLPALDTLMRRGYSSALGQMNRMIGLKRELGLDPDWRPTPRTPFVPLTERGTFHVYNVDFQTLTERQQRWVMRKCRIRPNSNMTVARLNHCMSILANATSHTNIYYSLRDTLEGYNLYFHMDAVRGHTVSGGVNFDTEEIASVLVNGTFRLGRRMPMEASVTGRFGKRLAAALDYTFLTSPLSGFRFNYTVGHDDIGVYHGGRRRYNPTYISNQGSISFVNMNFLRQNLKMELGSAFREYDFVNILSRPLDLNEPNAAVPPGWESDLMAMRDQKMWSYFVRLDYETLDSRYFTHRGTALSIDLDVFTDNLYRWRGGNPFSALSLSWTTAVPVTARLSLIPSIYGRVVSGSDIPFPAINMVGGKFFGRYTPHQMPFDGIGYMEAAQNVFLAAKFQGRYRVGRRHHVSGSFNYGISGNEFFDLGTSSGREYFGAALDYGYDLRRFPLSATLHWSNIVHTVGFYFHAGYMF